MSLDILHAPYTDAGKQRAPSFVRHSQLIWNQVLTTSTRSANKCQKPLKTAPRIRRRTGTLVKILSMPEGVELSQQRPFEKRSHRRPLQTEVYPELTTLLGLLSIKHPAGITSELTRILKANKYYQQYNLYGHSCAYVVLSVLIIFTLYQNLPADICSPALIKKVCLQSAANNFDRDLNSFHNNRNIRSYTRHVKCDKGCD